MEKEMKKGKNVYYGNLKFEGEYLKGKILEYLNKFYIIKLNTYNF